MPRSHVAGPLPALALALLAGLGGAAPAAGQDGAEVPEVEESAVEARVFQIRPASSPIVVDGVLDEPAWESADVIALPYETRPGENTEASQSTECRLTYDESTVYISFRAYDEDPSAIRAHLSDRDSAFNDDFVGVIFDTFNDERRAFEFFVNPLGVQMDLFMDDVGGNETTSFDAIWDSAGRLTEEGFEVELAIPFHQLRFPRGESVQTWGFDAVRFHPRSQRRRFASQPLERGRPCYLCQVSKLEGFAGITPGRNLEIVPTLTAASTEQRADFPDGPLTGGDVESDPGITGRWGLTPNLTLNAAINPDFSQVEADVAQLDVNTQFALFFPERRPFFLEGADFFTTPLDVVFTRTVADPDWGLKLTGKQEKNATGIFVARDSITNLLLPGSQGSRATSLDIESNDAAVRYRRDFGANSALGVLFTGREGGDYANRVGGVDGIYRFTGEDTLRFQVLGSSTRYPDPVAQQFGQPSGSFTDRAFHLNYTHSERNWFWYARYQDVGTDFRADLGFMPRVDYTFALGGVERHWWGEEDDWYTRFTLGGDWDLTEDQSGRKLEEELEFWVNLQGPLQSFIYLGPVFRKRSFNGVDFEEEYLGFYFEMEPTGAFEFFVEGAVGDDIDFAHTRPGDALELSGELRYNFGLRLRSELAHAFERLDVEGGRLFEANLTQLRLVYQFNIRSFLRVILQYTQVDRDPGLFAEEVDPQTKRLFTQLLYSWKLNPQTVLFVGYSDSRIGDHAIDLTQRNRTLFAKFGYAWVL